MSTFDSYGFRTGEQASHIQEWCPLWREPINPIPGLEKRTQEQRSVPCVQSPKEPRCIILDCVTHGGFWWRSQLCSSQIILSNPSMISQIGLLQKSQRNARGALYMQRLGRIHLVSTMPRRTLEGISTTSELNLPIMRSQSLRGSTWSGARRQGALLPTLDNVATSFRLENGCGTKRPWFSWSVSAQAPKASLNPMMAACWLALVLAPSLLHALVQTPGLSTGSVPRLGNTSMLLGDCTGYTCTCPDFFDLMQCAKSEWVDLMSTCTNTQTVCNLDLIIACAEEGSTVTYSCKPIVSPSPPPSPSPPSPSDPSDPSGSFGQLFLLIILGLFFVVVYVWWMWTKLRECCECWRLCFGEQAPQRTGPSGRTGRDEDLLAMTEGVLHELWRLDQEVSTKAVMVEKAEQIIREKMDPVIVAKSGADLHLKKFSELRLPALKEFRDYKTQFKAFCDSPEPNLAELPLLQARCHKSAASLQQAMEALMSAQTTYNAYQPSPSDNHYEILGLEPGCSAEAIRKAYLNLARMSHPDKVDKSGSTQNAAACWFRRVQEAHEILSDPEKRKAYDASMGFKTSGTGSAPAFCQGDRVRLRGLTTAKQYNGREGEVTQSKPPKFVVAIRFQGEVKHVSLGPENLEKIWQVTGVIKLFKLVGSSNAHVSQHPSYEWCAIDSALGMVIQWPREPLCLQGKAGWLLVFAPAAHPLIC